MINVAWPIIAAAIVVVFGAGQLVERIRNNKYVRKDVCNQKHKQEDERWQRIEKTLDRIQAYLDKG